MIFVQLSHQLISLRKLIESLSEEQYIRKINHLGGASIGKHSRHIIELLQCARNGLENGKVDYFNRERNPFLESDRSFAIYSISILLESILASDKQLELAIEEFADTLVQRPILTTYFRELIYNTEHAIHHHALIKVALVEMKLDIVDMDFGMAYSTIQFNSTQVIGEQEK